MAELKSYTIDQYQVFENMIKSSVERYPQIRFDLIIDGSTIMSKGDYEQLQANILEYFKDHSKKVQVLEFTNANGKKAVIEYSVERPTSKIIASRFLNKSIPEDEPQTLAGILDEKMDNYRKEMEHKQLQEKYNELEKKYKSLRLKYLKKIGEYDHSVEIYEKELDTIKNQIEELKKQASIGNQVFEGIKTAVPVLIQQKPVQNFLNGLAASQGITEPSNETVTKQPIAQEEEDEFSEEDWEHMNLILDVKEEVKDQFQVVTIILEMFMKDPSKIDEVITFLTFDKKPQS
jgi:tetratricopeptide (TPR) repeat protein